MNTTIIMMLYGLYIFSAFCVLSALIFSEEKIEDHLFFVFCPFVNTLLLFMFVMVYIATKFVSVLKRNLK